MTLSWRIVVLAGLVLAAYVALSLAGLDTSELIGVILTLAGFGGVGVHQAARADKQDKALAQITQQTNGVLTQRIETGARKAIRDELRKLGYPVQPDPTLD